MKLDELFERRLLRKIVPDKNKSSKSLEIAKKFLDDSKKLNNNKQYSLVILAAYTSMFHSARAILYRDGIQEKSHYATYIYLKNKYEEQLEDSIFELNNAREQRHEGLYGLEYEFNREDCNHIISEAERLLKKVKKELK